MWAYSKVRFSMTSMCRLLPPGHEARPLRERLCELHHSLAAVVRTAFLPSLLNAIHLIPCFLEIVLLLWEPAFTFGCAYNSSSY